MCLESDGHMKEGATKLKCLNFEIMNTCITVAVEVWYLNDVPSFNASWNREPEVDGLFDVFKLHGKCGVLCFFLSFFLCFFLSFLLGFFLCFFLSFLLGFFLCVLLFALAACSFAWMEVGAGGFCVSRLLALAAASLFFGFSPALTGSRLRGWLRRRSGWLRWSGFLSGFIKFLVHLVLLVELEEIVSFSFSRCTSILLVDLVWMELEEVGAVDLLDLVGVHGVGETELRHVAFCLLC